MSESQQRRSERILYVVLLVAACAILGAMLFTLHSGDQMIAKIGPLADATMKIGMDATEAHVYLMEAAVEFDQATIDTAMYFLRRADNQVIAILDGGFVGETKLAPLEDPVMRAEVEAIRQTVEHLLTLEQNLPKLLFEPHTHPDGIHRHDRMFSRLLEQTATFEGDLRRIIRIEHTYFRKVQLILMAVCIGFFIVVAGTLYRYLKAQRRYETRINRLNQILVAIRNVNHLITRERDRQKLIKSICELLVETRGLHNAWITLVDETGKPTIQAEAGLGELFSPALELLRKGVMLPCCLKSLKQDRVQVIEDPHLDCPECPLSEKYTGRGGLAIKLRHAHRVYGFLVVSTPVAYVTDTEEHALFAELAGDIGLSLHLIALEEERQQAESALRESEERYRALAANIPGCDIYLFDKDMRYLVAEGSEMKKNGLKSEFYEGRTLHETWDKDFTRILEPRYASALKGQTATVEYRCCNEFYALSTVPVYNSRKEIVGGIALTQNISARERAEKALRLTRFSIDHAAECVYWTNADGRIIDVNPAGSEMLGYSREEVLSLSVWDLDPAFPPEKYEAQKKVNKQHGSVTIESQHRAKDGRMIPIEAQINHVEFEGREYSCALIRDITERKEANDRQRFATEVLDLLNQSSPQTDTIREILALIKEFTDVEVVGLRLKLGDDYPYYETIGFPAAFVEKENSLCVKDVNDEVVVGEDNLTSLECMCGNVIRGRTDPNQPFFTPEGSFWSNHTSDLLATTTEEDRQSPTRNTCNASGYESVALIPLKYGSECIGLLQLNDSRKDMFSQDMINFFEGVGASIGIALSRKRTGEAMKRSESLLRHTFDAIPDLISVHDSEHNIVMSNWHDHPDAFERFQQGSKKCYAAYMDADGTCNPCHARGVFESKKPARLEITSPHDGITREISIYPVLDDADEVTLITETVRDITDRKKAEKLQSTLLRISVATNLTRNLDELLKIIHRALGDLIDTTNFYVALYDEDKDSYTFPYCVDISDDSDFPHKMRSRTLTDYVRRTGKPLLVDEPLHKKLCEMGEVDVVGEPSKIWLGVPLTTAHSVIGVVVVQSYTNADLYSESDKELMTVVSGHITMAVERKLAEEALRKSEGRLRAMYEQASVGVALISSDGRWLTVNERLCEIVGYSRDELLSMNCRDLKHPDDPDNTSCIVDGISLSSKRSCTCEKRYIRKDGRAVWVNISAAFVSEPDEDEQYMVAIIQDITERKNAERMIAKYTDQLVKANRSLEAKQSELEEFVYTISHDLKAPIVSISGFASLIKDKIGGEIEASSARHLERILANSVVMETLIGDLLELSRIGRTEEPASTFSFDELADEVIDSFSVTAAGRSIRLAKISETPQVTGHDQRIRQLLTNLLDNAIKYMPDERDGVIEVGFDKSATGPAGETGAYFVRDNGDGIPAEFHRRIFNMFQRAGVGNGNAAGSGVGLAIVKRIVQAHGGQVWLKSSEGQGAAFYFTLPGGLDHDKDNLANKQAISENECSGCEPREEKSQKEVKS